MKMNIQMINGILKNSGKTEIFLERNEHENTTYQTLGGQQI
jgi:hypothetical protein